VRFLDNIIDINKYALKTTEQNAFASRRIGLGVMGMAEYLFAKKIRYGSPKAILEVERLMRYIRDVAYEESIKLAEEKGAFPKFDSVAFSKAHFIRDLKPKMRMAIKKFGMRNVAVMAIAPTGTISMVAGVTSSAEPLPYRSFIRHDDIGDRIYVHPIYKELLDSGDDIPEWYVDITDLKPEDHLDTQAIIQKYVDGAVSKTIIMPKGTTADMLSDLMLEYIRDLKGVTVYVDGSRKDQPITAISHEETVNYLNEDMKLTDDNSETSECAHGNCEI
jgi:ribonucleoside-diphosphate reductase alpha chain